METAGTLPKPTRRQPAKPRILPGKRRVALRANGTGRRLNILYPNDPLDPPHNYSQSVGEAVAPLLVLDKELRVLTANESFRTAFKISTSQTLHRRVE